MKKFSTLGPDNVKLDRSMQRSSLKELVDLKSPMPYYKFQTSSHVTSIVQAFIPLFPLKINVKMASWSSGF